MFQHFEVSSLKFEVNSLKDVKVAIFSINTGGEVGYRAIIYDPLPDRLSGEEKKQEYNIYDSSSITDLTRLIFGKYVGVSRGRKDIVATIKTEPPGQLQFIKEKRHLAVCRPLSAKETDQLVQQLKKMFNI